MAAPTPAPSPGVHAAATDGSASTGTSGSGTTPSEMTAALDPVVEYESDADFHLAGDEEGLGYCSVCPLSKSNAYVAPFSVLLLAIMFMSRRFHIHYVPS